MFLSVVTFATQPELRTVMVNDTERSVMNGRIAIRQGRERVSFINVTAWGKLAEYIGTYYKKGDEIFVEGEIRNSDYKIDGSRSIQSNYILITNVQATYGQKSRRLAADTEISGDDIAETENAVDVEPVPAPKRGRKKAEEVIVNHEDDSE